MSNYYKGYYMVTARCNLACSYCILENAHHQLIQELDLTQKMELISHLYHNLGFRSLTLSGGEALMIGKKIPSDFLALLDFMKQFKQNAVDKNLKIKLYTNGIYLTEDVAHAMQGIVDEVSVNIDSCNKETLLRLGRNKSLKDDYFVKAVDAVKLLSKYSIKVKLHTVISALNYKHIASEVRYIYTAIKASNPLFQQWKIYQYMSYDDVNVDIKHQIDNTTFEIVKTDILQQLEDLAIDVHFKGNTEMNQSLFNILPTGVAQYMIPGDTWITSQRTKKLLHYPSMLDLFEKNKINVDLFNTYHSFIPSVLE